jgi:hypothetical protein
MFQTNLYRKSRKNFMFKTFTKIVPFMTWCEKVVQPERLQMTIWRMRIVCWYTHTYSMEQSPSWEANQSLPLVKIFPTFLWNPKVLYRTHKCPPRVPILSWLYPVPTPHSNLPKIHLNIMLPSTSGSPQLPLSFWLPHQHPVHTSLLSHTRHMTRLSHSSRFYYPHNIG